MKDGNNPWGNNGNKPPEFDELIDKGLKKLSSFFSGSASSNNSSNKNEKKKRWGIIPIIVIGFLVFAFIKSAYQIQPGEKGLVLRLGAYSRQEGPGLMFVVPFLDSVRKIDVAKIRKEEFGFRGSQNGPYGRASNQLKLESLMLTGDKNVIYLNWVVQYQINDPVKYLFEVKDPRSIVRDVSESVIRRLIGNRAFDYILKERKEIALLSKKEMQDLYNKYNLGIKLIAVQLLDVNPPDAVRAAFNDVNEADQDRTRLKNEAKDSYNKQIPKASGIADKITSEAKGYKEKRVNDAKGEVARFKSIYEQYSYSEKVKEVTKVRMYLETLNKVIPNLDKVYVVDQKQKGLIPLLNLGKSALQK